MHDPLHDYMRVGIVHFMAYPACMGGAGPIAETVERLARDKFFDVVEVTQIHDAAVRKQVRETAEQARVSLCFGAQPILLGGGLDLNHADDSERMKAVQAVKAGIDQAHEMGCEGVAVLSGKVAPDKDAAKERLIASLKDICGYAATKQLPVVLETFDQVPFGKNCLIGPTKDALEVSTEVRKSFPKFGLLLDLSHLPLIGESSESALKLAAAHLDFVHIGNCAMDDPAHPAYGDNHPRFGAPGTRNDTPQLIEFLRVLLDIGYIQKGARRIVSFEVKPMQGESAEAVIAGSQRTLLDAWRQV